VDEMKGFLEPESIAVIGASADFRKGGYSLVANLKEMSDDRLYPINPKHTEICGLPSYKTVIDVPEVVDLAIVYVSAPSVPAILEECGQKGIKRVMIQSAGFAETGEQGYSLERRCVSIAQQYGMRLWGPNCMGIVNGHSGMVASFMIPGTWKGNLQSGGVSVIVQSGMLSTSFLMHIIGEGYFGLSKACSIGNRCDVNECDLLEYMGQDPTTEVVALYLESLIDVPRFRKAIMNLKRPVILIKGGTSAEGARAAKSHTASLAGNAQVAEGFFQQLGIYRARDFIEMMDLTRALVLWRGRKGGKRVAIVTFSGAAGIVASDHLVEQGMTLATLSPETVEKLKTVYPPWMEPENPVDIWPAVERNGRRSQGVAFEALLNDPQVDAIFFHIYVDSLIMRVGLDFMESLKGSVKPVVVWVIGDPSFFRELRDHGESMGIPVYREIERGARALSLMAK
jgi:acetyltransferase